MSMGVRSSSLGQAKKGALKIFGEWAALADPQGTFGNPGSGHSKRHRQRN
jgi:hypothetical protein